MPPVPTWSQEGTLQERGGDDAYASSVYPHGSVLYA